LFGYLTQAQMTELGELVDRLEARLGQGSCWSPRTLDQHVPEAAWHAVPPLRAGKTGASAGRRLPQSVDGTRHQRTRPVWLFEPPRAIEARQLTLLRGPERIGSGWWSDRPATAVTVPDVGQDWRDYYVARLENGTECWVFVDAASRWHLHGYFG
jgi:protein ImuB